MTANETRLGMKISGPSTDTLKTSGRVEIDFYEGGAENQARPRMRHAYMVIDLPQQRLSILAGQTTDVISPLYPSTLNYSTGWWAGNIGYRRPQIRVTKDIALTEDVDLRLQGALTRTIGDDLVSGFDPGDTGEDYPLPGVQGRVAVTFPCFGPKPTVVGISTHWGREEYDKDASDTHENLDTWSVNLDIVQPVNDWLVVKGELYTGENLDAYLGGIGQGVNHTRVKEIGACGGWLAATLTPLDRWTFNVGATVEAVDTDDIDETDSIEDRTLNKSIFSNAIYSINEKTSVGIEVSHWFTEYKHSDKGGSLRLQGSFIYKF